MIDFAFLDKLRKDDLLYCEGAHYCGARRGGDCVGSRHLPAPCGTRRIHGSGLHPEGKGSHRQRGIQCYGTSFGLRTASANRRRDILQLHVCTGNRINIPPIESSNAALGNRGGTWRKVREVVREAPGDFEICIRSRRNRLGIMRAPGCEQNCSSSQEQP